MHLGSVLDSLNGSGDVLAGLSGAERTTKTPEQVEPFVEQVERVTLLIVALPPILDMQSNPRDATLPVRGFTRAMLAQVDYAFDLIASKTLKVTDSQRERLLSAREDLDEMLETFNLTVEHIEAIQAAIATER